MAASSDNVVEMTFADTQLSGIYRTIAYRKMIRSFSDDKVDSEIISELEAIAATPRGNDPASMSHYALFSAAGTCAAFVMEMLDGELNTLDVRQWLALHNALVCANRLVCIPDYVVEEGVTVPNLVMSVAMICDIMMRLADDDTRHVAPLPDLSDDTVTRRGFGIYRDILCGRVGFWLSAVDDLACQVCMMMQTDWFEMRDTYAAAKMSEYVTGLGEAFGLSTQAASSVFMSQFISFAGLFDTHQATIWDESADTISVPSEELREKSFHEEQVATFVENAPAGLAEYGSHMKGFCASSGVSAPDSVFFVPRSITAECVSAMEQLNQ